MSTLHADAAHIESPTLADQLEPGIASTGFPEDFDHEDYQQWLDTLDAQLSPQEEQPNYLQHLSRKVASALVDSGYLRFPQAGDWQDLEQQLAGYVERAMAS